MKKNEQILLLVAAIMILVVAVTGLLVGAGIAIAPTTAQEDAPWVVMQTAVELNVRWQPSTSGSLFSRLPEGTPVYVQLPEKRGIESWARIELPEGYFWVCYTEGDDYYLVEYSP